MTDLSPLLVSLRVTIVATLVASAAGITVAYALAKMRSRWASVIEAIITVPIVLPPTVLGYYLLTLLGSRGPIGRAWEGLFGSAIVFTVTGATIAATVSALPFVVRTSRAAIRQVDPRLEEAARICGLPEREVAIRVTLRVASRGILAGVALGFARALGDFGVTVMVAGNVPGRSQTLPVAVYDAVQAGDDTYARNGSLVLAAIALVVLLLLAQLQVRRSR
jgi:molybdate transport system permease protein